VLRTRAPAYVRDDALLAIARGVRSNHRDQLECLGRLLTSPSDAGTVVAGFLARWSGALSLEDIALAAAQRYDVPLAAIYSDARTRTAADARRACYYLSRRLLGRPYAAIGRHFGRRGHTTVLDACRVLQNRPGPEVRSLLRELQKLDAARI
ncbi:MAG: helix-turn-helix domain-containing protein, partial [Planctomycetota bacterium]